MYFIVSSSPFLSFQDIEYVDKEIAKMEKTVVRGGDKAREFEYKTLLKVAEHIKGEFLGYSGYKWIF